MRGFPCAVQLDWRVTVTFSQRKKSSPCKHFTVRVPILYSIKCTYIRFEIKKYYNY